MKRLKVAFSAGNPRMQGGIAKHDYFLKSALMRHIDIYQYSYSARCDNESTWKKVLSRTQDLHRAYSIMKKCRPDLIHHNTAFDSRSILRDAPLAWTARLAGVPLFLKIHGSRHEALGRVNPFLSWFRSSLLRNARLVGVLSERERQEIASCIPNDRIRLCVVKNLIAQEFFDVVRCEAPRPLILFVSRFIRKKGPFDLLDAVPMVRNEYPTAQFIFGGSGPDVVDFLSEVKSRSLDALVTWVGELDHKAVRELLSRSWVLVFPTHFPEGMPMVVAEAMAAGVPIVTTRTRFSTSYMQERKHCLYVDNSSPCSLAQAICTLIGSDGLRNDISANNRDLAKVFTSNRVVSEYLSIYSDIMMSREAENPK